VGDNSFAPKTVEPGYGTFVVQNTASPPKTIHIFHYPIPAGCSRNLLAIPGCGESDIRASLLKGELNTRLYFEEIKIIASDIDLLQFNNNQAEFLYASGVATGVQIGIQQQAFVWNQDIQLVGAVNGSNTTFTIPSGTFIQSGFYKIIVYLNGVKQSLSAGDYTIASSGLNGSGYDTVIFAVPPESAIPPPDVVTADYWQSNIGGS
jgi:hypothetical protein